VSSGRVADKKKKTQEDRIVVKPKSTEKYVGWPNNNTKNTGP